MEGGEHGKGEDEDAGAAPPPAVERRGRDGEEWHGGVVVAVADDELVAGPGGRRKHPEQQGDEVDVVDGHPAIEGGCDDEIAGDEESEESADAPQCGRKQAVGDILPEPKQDVDVLVLPPGGKEEEQVQMCWRLYFRLTIEVIYFVWR